MLILVFDLESRARSLTCLGCQKIFRRPNALSTHLIHRPQCKSACDKVVNNPLLAHVIHRRSYTVAFKCQILLELSQLEETGTFFPQTILRLAHTGLTAKNISDWHSKRDYLFTLRAQGYGRNRRVRQQVKGLFSDCEDQVYMLFFVRRTIHGFKTGDSWLCRRMKEELEKQKPTGWQDHKNPSNGWVTKFKRRYCVTEQARTNKASIPVWVRVSDCKAFHVYWLIYIQRSHPQNCPIYGRFPASHIFYSDHIPVSFINNAKRSLNMIGKPCFIKQPHGSGLEKRLATIWMTLCAGPNQLKRITVILRGTGARLTHAEQMVYQNISNYVRVLFQPAAWADEQVSLIWLDDFDAETLTFPFQRCMGMDKHGAQMTIAFRSSMSQKNIFGCYIPAPNTDLLAPVDHHAGIKLKNRMGEFYHAELEDNDATWCNPPDAGGLHDWQKRVKVVMWAAAAWQELRQDYTFIKSTFVSTGWLIAKDGSENHLIKLKGIDNYDFTAP